MAMWKVLYSLARCVPGSVSGSFGSRLRILLLRRAGANIGEGCVIRPFAKISAPGALTLGNCSGIGSGNILGCQGGVAVGARVMIGTDVIVYTTNHVWSEEVGTYAGQGLSFMPVSIGDDAWIGSRAIILPGVRVGKGATIGAGAVVTKDVADYAVAVGVPARTIKIKQHREQGQ